MTSGNIDLGPVIWWGFGLCLLFAVCVAVVIRLVLAAGRRGHGPTDRS